MKFAFLFLVFLFSYKAMAETLLVDRTFKDCTVESASSVERDGTGIKWDDSLKGTKLAKDSVWLTYIKLSEWDGKGEIHAELEDAHGARSLLQFGYGAPRIYFSTPTEAILGPAAAHEQMLMVNAGLVDGKLILDVHSRWYEGRDDLMFKPYMLWLARLCDKGSSNKSALTSRGRHVCGIFPYTGNYTQYVDTKFTDEFSWSGNLRLVCTE